MEDLKIRVENEAKSKEAQELFFELGATWLYKNSGKKTFYTKGDIFLFCTDGVLGTGDIDDKDFFNKHPATKITLPQLRDKVVLKRNCVDDANRINHRGEPVYSSSDNIDHIHDNGKWVKSYYQAKPIEKEMKEYLDSGKCYAYVQSECKRSDDWIEIPEGCNIITRQYRMGSIVHFHWKCFDSDEFFLKDEKIWSNNFGETLSDFIEKNEGDVVVIWQRSTQLADDKQTLNDKYKEIEMVRQKHSHYFKDVSHLNQIDVYDILKLFNVIDPCLQHIVKKALCAGKRGHKGFKKDLQDISDTARRALAINGV